MDYHLFLTIFMLLGIVGVVCPVDDLIKLIDGLDELSKNTNDVKPEYYKRNSAKNHIIWETYYNCLNKMSELASTFRLIPPASKAAMQGGTVRLDCDLCFSPALIGHTKPSWLWFDEPLPENEWTTVDEKTGKLAMYGVKREQAGVYRCKFGTAESRANVLHVEDPELGLRLVKGPNSKKGPWSNGEYNITLQSGLLVVHPSWSEWSQCSRCDEVGRHYRFGPCTVRLIQGITPKKVNKREVGDFSNVLPKMKQFIKETLNDTSKALNKVNKKLKSQNKKLTYFLKYPRKRNDDLTTAITSKIPNSTQHLLTDVPAANLFILELFPEGLPCKSQLLPEDIRHIGKIMETKNELMEAYCKPSCIDEVFEVKDSLGNVLEVVNNSEGVFSTFQGPPKVPPSPNRDSVFIPFGTPLNISCPGNLDMDVPYSWTVMRKKRLYPIILANESEGRVRVDYRQRILFREVEPSDSNLYVCWQRGSIAGVVRLVVYDPSTVKFDHHMMLLGTTVILGSFVYLFYRIYINRQRAAVA